MPLDKQVHFLVGAVIALALGYILPIVYGLAVAVLMGAIKELYDHFHPATHTVDVWDFVATAAGGAVGSLFVLFAHT